MTLATYRTAIVDWAKAAMPEFRHVVGYGGEMDLEQVLRVSFNTPALFVCVANVQPVDHQHYKAKVLLYVVAQDQASPFLSRDVVALTLVNKLLDILPTAEFDYDGERLNPAVVMAQNLFANKYEQKALAVWLLAFEQMIELTGNQGLTLVPLNTVHMDIRDGDTDFALTGTPVQADVSFTEPDAPLYPYSETFDYTSADPGLPVGWTDAANSGAAITRVIEEQDLNVVGGDGSLRIGLVPSGQAYYYGPDALGADPVNEGIFETWLKIEASGPASMLGGMAVAIPGLSAQYAAMLLEQPSVGLRAVALFRIDGAGATMLNLVNLSADYMATAIGLSVQLTRDSGLVKVHAEYLQLDGNGWQDLYNQNDPDSGALATATWHPYLIHQNQSNMQPDDATLFGALRVYKIS